MDYEHKQAIWVVIVLVVLAFMIMYFGEASAGRYIHIENNYYEENNYEVTNEFFEEESGVSSGDLDSTAAQFMAADAIYCSTGTKKNQMGVGMGYRSGKNGYAAGFCRAAEIGGHPVTVGYKASGASGVSAAHSIGINWTF